MKKIITRMQKNSTYGSFGPPRGSGDYSRTLDRLESETKKKQQVEVDLIINHPMGMTEAMKNDLVNAWLRTAELLGCSVSGSFTLENEL